ncbi:RNA polymerase sigma-70 factor [Sunxiuqinia elliptica]|uniref:RNA polymerase sigma factor n=1 Tax=Sunxiuqinia elliptica TaxID=655355 RepID=A0A4V3BZ98_9BACT|nr:RNA polymerase sigma-70 factor [Sunxiuqinia elliptica]TDO05709.1 RNA polymerase sigma-70 factor (ECF subfamily) [Sunxiuqinia elliptica]TDO65251.1 RNA polymerase sigma-70 factor (ECF subfamily) [Sunxiuqinia elliptica]
MDQGNRYQDKDLVVQLKSNSSSAFQALFEKYSQRIYRFSLGYLKSTQEAEEIVQDVFLRVWKAREELLVERSFESYLFTIAKNTILNTIRKANYEKAYLEYSSLHSNKNSLLDEELDFKELDRIYRRAIEKLPARRKEVYRLSRDNGLSNREIANELGISVKTVENQMTAALSAIKKELLSYGISGGIFFELFL